MAVSVILTLVAWGTYLLATRRTGSRGCKLSPMIRQRPLISLPVYLLVIASACSGEKASPRTDSALAAHLPAAQLPSPVANTGWDEAVAGPVILVPVSDSGARAAVVLPYLTDSTLSHASAFQLDSLANLPVDLFGPSGAIASGTLLVVSQKSNMECPSWPVASLFGSLERSWRVGFRKGVAQPLPLDSLEGMNSSDSSLISTELARLASAVAEGADPAFRGLPFSIRKAYRFSMGATSVVVGNVLRKINEEANPREENLLLIAERSPSTDGKYVVAFQSRATGSEDLVRTNDVLGAVRFVRTNRLAVVVSFEYEDGGRIILLDRVADTQWKITWRSAYAGC